MSVAMSVAMSGREVLLRSSVAMSGREVPLRSSVEKFR
jgi:hypothetical protein